MVRNRRPIRGGKSKFNRDHNERPRKKKEKFDLRTTWYIKERKLQNEEIEERRKRLEEQKNKRRNVVDEESSEEEAENPLDSLLSTFQKKVESTAIYSETESESEEEASTSESGKQEKVVKDEDEDSESGDDDEDVESVEEHSVSEEEEEIMFSVGENEEDAETAREDAGHLADPFSLHLRNDLEDSLYNIVSSTSTNHETHKLNWPALGNLVCLLPRIETSENEGGSKKKKPRLLEDKQYAKPGEIPKIIHKIDWNNLYIKSQIQGNISRANYNFIKEDLSKKQSPLTELQKELFSIINNYQDLLYLERTFSNAEEIRFVYCLHAVNHVLKTRTKILHHNAKLLRLKKGNVQAMVPDEYRDQGLVRPKVLIVVPFKHSCLKIVELLIAILIGEDKGGSVVNKIRFMENFSGNDLRMPKKKPKPEDYEETFKGQTDDSFKIGMSFTKKTLKLYTDFYSSDIIISSPLGLRKLIGAEGEEQRDYDFLASIELLIMDQTDLFMMQNWDHLLHVLNHLHLQPKSAHDADFSRVRSWCANGWSKYYRQTLIFSSLQFPEIHSILNKQCHNYAGKVKVVNPVTSGTVPQVVTQLPLVFHRMEVANHLEAMNARLDFFASKVLPHYKDSIMNHTLIFVPSYFDYVALRNYFHKEELSFVQICEFGKPGSVAKARDMFYHSSAHFLLYTERAHFFFRYRIKGIRHLIFYAPPMFPHFYSEMCNLMQEGYQNQRAGSESNMTVTTIYSKYDILQLAAIVGTERAQKMLRAEKHVHMLMTRE